MPKPWKSKCSKSHQYRQERYRQKQDARYLKLFSKKPKPAKASKNLEEYHVNHEEKESLPISCGDIPKYLLVFMVIFGGIKFLTENSPILLVEAARLREMGGFDQSQSFNSSHQLYRKSNAAKTTLPASQRYFKGLPVQDITFTAKDCKRKSDGCTSGKICNIDGKEYFLKVPETANDDLLLAKYNLLLAEQNIGITVPTTKIFYEDGELSPENKNKFFFTEQYKKNHYLATEKIEFTPARKLQEMGFSTLFKFGRSINRDELVKKIGEAGIAKLGVAETFFGDFNLGNWGYDQEGLAVVDLDKSPSWRGSWGYHNWWRTASLFTNFNVQFSIDNIKEMKNIYQSMQSKFSPRFHHSVDMSEEMYQKLLNIFITACDKIIDDYTPRFDSTFNTATALEDITRAFANEIYVVGYEHEDEPQNRLLKFMTAIF